MKLKYMPAECIFCLVSIFPGVTANQIARRFNMHPALVVGRLMTLEHRGILLSEDSIGGLYPFNICRGEAEYEPQSINTLSLRPPENVSCLL